MHNYLRSDAAETPGSLYSLSSGVLTASLRDTTVHGLQALLPFQPKYRLGHPENYLFLLSKSKFAGSKNPKNNLI